MKEKINAFNSTCKNFFVVVVVVVSVRVCVYIGKGGGVDKKYLNTNAFFFFLSFFKILILNANAGKKNLFKSIIGLIAREFTIALVKNFEQQIFFN